MEMRAKSQPPEKSDKELSAHQFSYHSLSIQCDSEERADIAMQTSVIDLKSMNQQVDIYDLAKIRDASVQNSIEPGKSKFLKSMRNVGA